MVDDQQGPGKDPMDGMTSSVGGDSPAAPGPGGPSQGMSADSGMNAGVPAVASGGTKNVFVLAVAVIVAAIFIFNVFSGDDPKEVEDAGKKVGTIDIVGADLPEPPPPAPSIPAIPPPPPPPPAPLAPPPMVDSGTVAPVAAKKALTLPEERRKSSMVVSGGTLDSIGLGGKSGTTLEGGVEGDGNADILENTNAAQVKATLAGEPINMVAQGKIIDAVLETAINSDLSGIIRAVVSRDVYAEAGKRVLIPKGSRLVGSYDIAVKRGQSRVFIIWNRVLRPDGVDVVIGSPGSDSLGRAGVKGDVDGKYLDVFSNAILFSSITVAFAFAAEKAINADGLSETENTSGSLTTSGSPSDIAVVESIGDFGDVVSNVASEVVDLRPTITVDQGTRMKVFVNKDLKFPSIFQSDVVFIK